MVAVLVLPGHCPECGTAERRKPMGEAEVVVKLHTPSCTLGRCGAGAAYSRCIKVGKAVHGGKHENIAGHHWEGEWVSLDQELEDRDH